MQLARLPGSIRMELPSSTSRFQLLLISAYSWPYTYFPLSRIGRPSPPLPLLLLIWFVARFLPTVQANHDNCVILPSRPFYLIGHMTNSLSDVKRFLAGGANALEIDVQFDSEGMIDSVYHGIPCDCFRYCSNRESADVMFDYIREASTPGSAIHSPHFNLLLLDLKIRRLSPDAKHTAGVLVADRIIERLFGPIHATSWSPAANESLPRLRLVIGLELTADRPFVAAMIERLMDRESGALLSRIGFDVSGNEKVHVIEHLWQHVFRGRLNVWQGDGITNCLSLVRSSNRLKQLIAMREQAPDLPYLAKVYHWTIDSRRVLKDSLRLRVDGVITNDPSIVLETLADPEFRNEYHMARYEDDPFCVVRESQLQALRIGPPEPMSHTHDQQSLLNQLLLNDLVEHSALPSESKPNTHSMSLSNESPTLAPPLSPSAFPSSFESTTESEISNNEHVHKHHRPHHQHHSLHPQRKKPSSPALNQAFESDNLIRTAYGNDFKRSSLVDFNLLRFVQLLRQLHSSSYRPPSSSSTPFAALRFPNGGHVPLHQRLIGSPSIWHSRPNPNRMSDSWPSWAGSSSSSPLASIASLQNDDLVSVMHALQSSLRTLPTSRSVNATSRSSIETHA